MSSPDPLPTANPVRRIAHVDMDAFYASVELLRRPDLKGLPIAIGGRGDPNSRAVVTTATYEARQFGVKSGVSLYQAKQLCPQLIMLPVDFEQYRHYSRLFKAALKAICPVMEDRGIDEVYLDLTALAEDSLAIATQLQQAVFAATSLTCSIGIAPNKLLAKICSDLNKPNGITLLTEDQIQARIWPLPVKRINGVGPKANDKLASFGVETIGQLAQVAPHLLIRQFGQSYGRWLHEAAFGRDTRSVQTESESVSISRETTLDKNWHVVRDRELINQVMHQLCQGLERDLARKKLIAKQVGIKVRYEDFKSVTRDFSLREPISDANVIFQAALQCLDRAPDQLKIRLIGVRLAQLADAQQAAPGNLDLFESN
jgi:DNA polymerase IV